MRPNGTALRFGIVGVANTLLDFAVFMALVHGLMLIILWANVIAFLVAVTNSFLLNRYWTFRNISGYSLKLGPAYLRFLAVNSVGMALGTAVIYLLLPFMAIEPAKVVSVGASLVWNYFGSRYFVFMSNNKT
jgi:putative flippase GtrA